MSFFNIKIHSRFGEARAKYDQACQRAVAQVAISIQRESKKLLGRSGKGVTAKLGLNKVSGKGTSKLSGAEKTELRYKQGLESLDNVKTVHGRKSKLTFGGSKDGHDRIYWYREPLHRWVQASAPGTPPHKQTGNLQQIAVEFSGSKFKAKIGPRYGLKYARIQELGGKGLVNLAARPYMRPALEIVGPQIPGIFEKHLKRVST